MSPVRVQRFIMGTILLIALLLIHSGYSWGEYLIWFMIAMLYIAAFTGFCPSDTILGKIFGKNTQGQSCSQ
jgi:hypothetical protein